MSLQPGPRAPILLVDGHRGVREALAQLLEDNGMTVCGRASGREEALALVDLQGPELALVEVLLGEDDGLALVGELYRRGISVVVCSSREEPEYVRRSLDAGARAYVAKRDAGQALVRTLRDVLGGWVLISPHAAEGLRYKS